MSRIGKLAIEIPENVEVSLDNSLLTVKSGKSLLEEKISSVVKVVVDGRVIIVSPSDKTKFSRSMWGTTRSKISAMIEGVTKGYEVRIVVKGVGYRSSIKDNILKLTLGYSHDIYYALPKDIVVKCETPTLIVISGSSKQLVGQVTAEIKSLRKVEPYKGKGVYVEGSYIRRKEGKKK